MNMLRKNLTVALPLALGAVMLMAGLNTSEALGGQALYWCPSKPPDLQYANTPGPGCSPFVIAEEERQKAERRKKEGKPTPVINAERIETEASRFLQRYKRFLDCCATDVDSLDDLQELQDQASDLLKAIQETNLLQAGRGGPNTVFRQFTLAEIIRPLAQARDNLRELNGRLSRIADSVDRLETLDYEAASREQRRIEEEKAAISREIRPRRPPDAPRTGMEVEDTTIPNRIGTKSSDTTLPNVFGEDIGAVVSPSTKEQESLRPRVGMDSVDTTIPTRPGPTSQDTSLPNRFGFEAGTEQGAFGPTTTPSRVGPAIGDSSLNKR